MHNDTPVLSRKRAYVRILSRMIFSGGLGVPLDTGARLKRVASDPDIGELLGECLDFNSLNIELVLGSPL